MKIGSYLSKKRVIFASMWHIHYLWLLQTLANNIIIQLQREHCCGLALPALTNTRDLKSNVSTVKLYRDMSPRYCPNFQHGCPELRVGSSGESFSRFYNSDLEEFCAESFLLLILRWLLAMIFAFFTATMHWVICYFSWYNFWGVRISTTFYL